MMEEWPIDNVLRVKWGGASPLTKEDAIKIAEFAGQIIRERKQQGAN